MQAALTVGGASGAMTPPVPANTPVVATSEATISTRGTRAMSLRRVAAGSQKRGVPSVRTCPSSSTARAAAGTGVPWAELPEVAGSRARMSRARRGPGPPASVRVVIGVSIEVVIGISIGSQRVVSSSRIERGVASPTKRDRDRRTGAGMGSCRGARGSPSSPRASRDASRSAPRRSSRRSGGAARVSARIACADASRGAYPPPLRLIAVESRRAGVSSGEAPQRLRDGDEACRALARLEGGVAAVRGDDAVPLRREGADRERRLAVCADNRLHT